MRLEIFQPLNLAYISNNKVASTTIGHILKHELIKYMDTSEIKNVSRIIHIDLPQIDPYIKSNKLYLFTFVRNPYTRAISSYNYRVNYYVKKYEKVIYLRANLKKFLDGPKGWRSYHKKNRYAAALFSFDRFIEGLARNGTDFDIHVKTQSALVGFDYIDHIQIGKIENFTDDFMRILHIAGFHEDEVIKNICNIKLNYSKSRININNYLNEPNKIKINKLYKEDFVNFKYRE